LTFGARIEIGKKNGAEINGEVEEAVIVAEEDIAVETGICLADSDISEVATQEEEALSLMLVKAERMQWQGKLLLMQC
jgi:hypothetical protein